MLERVMVFIDALKVTKMKEKENERWRRMLRTKNGGIRVCDDERESLDRKMTHNLELFMVVWGKKVFKTFKSLKIIYFGMYYYIISSNF